MRFIFPHRHINTDTLSNYLDERLSVSGRQRVARHLESCAQCQEELESLRTTVSYLQDLPEFTAPRRFTFVAPPPEPVTATPGVTLFVPAWAYAGAASLAGLALALLVLVDATGFSPSSTASDLPTRTLVQSRPAAPFDAVPAVEQSEATALPQAPAAPASLPAAAAAPNPVPGEATPTPAGVAQPEMAAAAAPSAVPGEAAPTPAGVAQPEMAAAAREADIRATSRVTPTPQVMAKVEEAVADAPASFPGNPPGQPTTVPPARRATPTIAMPGAKSGGGGLVGPTPPPPTTATLPTRFPATPAPSAEAPLAESEAPAQPSVAPRAEAEVGPTGASSQPATLSGPAGAAGPTGPAIQAGDSSRPALANPQSDSRDEYIPPRRREYGSRWRLAQAMAATLVVMFIGGLLFEVRRSRRSGSP